MTMVRKKQIEEMATVKAKFMTADQDMQLAFRDAIIVGANWADENPKSHMEIKRNNGEVSSNEDLTSNG